MPAKHRFQHRVHLAFLGALAPGLLVGSASADVAVLTSTLDGAQAVPPVVTAASGSATVTVDDLSGYCRVVGQFTGLSAAPTAVSLRGPAAPGSTGPLLLALTATAGTTGTFEGSGTLGATEVSDLRSGLVYVDVETPGHGPAEVRGQVLWPVVTIHVELDGSQVVPPVPTAATAAVDVTVDRNTNEVTFDGSYSNLAGVIHDAHLHAPAWFGQHAPHVGHMTFSPGTTSGAFGGSEVLSSSLIEEILRGNAYLMVHSAAFPPGEIRGQVFESPALDFCPASPNSTGAPAQLGASGSPVVADDDLTLHVAGLPAGTTAMLLNSPAYAVVHSPAAGGTPSDGDLCIAGGPLGRHMPRVLAPGASSFDLALDLMHLPTPLGSPTYSVAIAPGDTWLWQCWFRDQSPPSGRNNFSNAIAVTFR